MKVPVSTPLATRLVVALRLALFAILVSAGIVSCIQESTPTETAEPTSAGNAETGAKDPKTSGYDDNVQSLLANFHLRRGEELEGQPNRVSKMNAEQLTAAQIDKAVKKSRGAVEVFLVEYKVSVPATSGGGFDSRVVRSYVSVDSVKIKDGNVSARYTLRRVIIAEAAGKKQMHDLRPDVFLERALSAGQR